MSTAMSSRRRHRTYPPKTKLAYVEWDQEGKVCRIIHEVQVDDSHLNIADRIARRLRTPHRLDEWDVDWCRRNDCYYVHESGSWSGRIYLNKVVEGYRIKFWADEHIEFSSGALGEEELTPEQISELGYDRVTLEAPPEDLTQTCEEDSCYWCSVCNDMIPLQDLCAHMHWCDNCGSVITPDDAPCGEECSDDE